MNFKSVFGVLLVGFALQNCQKNQQAHLDEDAKLMATLECEAHQLKEERFNVANDIRFMEDSLAKHKLVLSKTQSAEIDSVIASYTLRTGKLAGKITKTMDSLFATTYHSREERDQFDKAVETVLLKICH